MYIVNLCIHGMGSADVPTALHTNMCTSILISHVFWFSSVFNFKHCSSLPFPPPLHWLPGIACDVMLHTTFSILLYILYLYCLLVLIWPTACISHLLAVHFPHLPPPPIHPISMGFYQDCRVSIVSYMCSG